MAPCSYNIKPGRLGGGGGGRVDGACRLTCTVAAELMDHQPAEAGQEAPGHLFKGLATQGEEPSPSSPHHRCLGQQPAVTPLQPCWARTRPWVPLPTTMPALAPSTLRGPHRPWQLGSPRQWAGRRRTGGQAGQPCQACSGAPPQILTPASVTTQPRCAMASSYVHSPDGQTEVTRPLTVPLAGSGQRGWSPTVCSLFS